MVATIAYLRGLRYGLPRSVTILQAGLVVNAFGNGAANPFLVLYLHDVRGIPLGLAGLAGATNGACALVAALVAGSVADRRGHKPTMIAGLLCSAVAFALYPLVRSPWHAVALAVLGGSGIGTWLTMQSSVLAAIVPAALRHAAFARQRVAANLGPGLGGLSGGFIVSISHPRSFTALFLLNAATFLVYTVFLLRVAVPGRPAAVRERDYRDVVRDQVFVRVALLNFLFVAGAVSLLNGLFPVYAKNEGHVGEHTIGLLFLLNSLLIVALQMPTARAVEGRGRMRCLALMGSLFASCWLLVLAGGTAPAAAVTVPLLVAGVTAMSLGECLYDSVQGPLVSDLAPPELTGRYMALFGFSWQLGFIAGPGLGGFVLGAAPSALWVAAAAVSLCAGLWALAIERTLPAGARTTPARV